MIKSRWDRDYATNECGIFVRDLAKLICLIKSKKQVFWVLIELADMIQYLCELNFVDTGITIGYYGNERTD